MFTTASLRAVLPAFAALLILAGLSPPAVGGVQVPDTASAAQAPRSTAADSLRALQHENDSLRAALERPRASTLQEVGAVVQSLGLRVFWALVVLALTHFVVRGLGYVLESLAERNARRRLFFTRLVPLLRVALWSLAAYLVLHGILGVTAEGLLIAAAAVGIAVGFAAQDPLKNLLGGLVIVFDQPFQVGDRISVGGTYGEVTAIGLYSTRIATPDDTLVSVPNAQGVDGQVANANAGALDCQVVTDLYLPGWADEARAKQIAYEAAASSAYVFLQKPIVVLVRDEFKETFLTHLRVKAYVIDARYESRLMSDITERARRAFREEGLLPPPTHEVWTPHRLASLTYPEENGQPANRTHPPSSHSAGESE